jgi:CheY-like chemotaxis protein
MRILVADDDLFFRRALEATLVDWGYQVVLASEGAAAWQVLQGEDPPRLALLDWVMPNPDGLEICRRLRAASGPPRTHLILLTAKDAAEDVVVGLEGGADDYITKPFERDGLRARLRAGLRNGSWHSSQAGRVRELETTLARVQQLQGLLPICCYCKRIRDGQDSWQQLEAYISAHSQARFSHGICPECLERETPRPGKSRGGPTGLSGLPVDSASRVSSSGARSPRCERGEEHHGQDSRPHR